MSIVSDRQALKDWRADRSTNLAVAEAVGFVHGDDPCDRCLSDDAISGKCVPDYLHDWDETGPLIELYGISVTPDRSMPGTWGAWVGDFAPLGAREATPLRSVCALVLYLKHAGKLVPCS